MAAYTVDHDFNNTWGTILSVTELRSRPRASELLREYWDDPVSIERSYSSVLRQYTDVFETFFAGVLPISFHGHVTDALNPTTIASMMLRLAIFSMTGCQVGRPPSFPTTRAEARELLGWTERHLSSPRLVLLENGYAAAFGPLANVSIRNPWRDVATGASSICLKLADLLKPRTLTKFLTEAKTGGCIAVVAEIVQNQSNGRVITPEEFQNLRDACSKTGLLLGVDETLTAIRCGAAFAHQRPEYAFIAPPDLVFFGKALVVNGTGINFKAPFIKKLGIKAPEDQRQAITVWQHTGTQAVQLPLLISGLGALEMAISGNWVGRSLIIGQNIRDFVLARAQILCSQMNVDNLKEMILGGLGCFIFVKIEIAGSFLVMSATNGGCHTGWVRWLPRLDEHLEQKDSLEKILSTHGAQFRKEFSAELERNSMSPPWCFWCGNRARNTLLPWCRNCCINVCGDAECLGKLREHECLSG